MLYADAVCKGLDDLPAVPAEIRQKVAYPRSLPNGKEESREEWLQWLQSEVQRLDPDYWKIVDQQNPARLMHCVELSLTAGKPYSSLLTRTMHNAQCTMHNAQLGVRPFRIVKVALERDREELYDRINRRVEQMIADGLEQEARAVYPKRHLTSLQTVGYREMFAYFDGEYDLDRAIELIQQNSRHYAKRQLTWFRRDKEIHWLNANNAYEKNIHIIDDLLGSCGLQKED
jgi:tRNA dimethylallyltransferase